jgi:hypothetical protein
LRRLLCSIHYLEIGRSGVSTELRKDSAKSSRYYRGITE